MSSNLTSYVAGEVRAGLARNRRTQLELALVLGVSQATIARRLAGSIPFDVAEIETVARFLGVPVESLLGRVAS
jgi:transcriptional regulator with XRE-family HTH domain